MCWAEARKAEPDFFIMMMDDIGIRAEGSGPYYGYEGG
tara:strand:- start:128 stop:241 length:114 start_codon:yes stop_codon:yes gene_type:complete